LIEVGTRKKCQILHHPSSSLLRRYLGPDTSCPWSATRMFSGLISQWRTLWSRPEWTRAVQIAISNLSLQKTIRISKLDLTIKEQEADLGIQNNV